MSRHQGWNDERVGGWESNTSHATEVQGIFANESIAGFTPVNHSIVARPSLPLMKSAPCRGIDSESIFDLPAEDELNPSLLSPRKATSRSEKGKVAPIGWGGDPAIAEEGIRAHPEGPPTQRRKLVPERRDGLNSTANITSQNAGAFLVEKRQAAKEGMSESQVVAPLGPAKRWQNRAKSSAANARNKKPGPFKQLTITKPTSSKGKMVSSDVPRSQPVSHHQGWKTTEDVLKSTHKAVAIAKTTLDKLTAFRYKPTDDDKTTVSPSTNKSRNSVPAQLSLPELPDSDHSRDNCIANQDDSFQLPHTEDTSPDQQDSVERLANTRELMQPSSDYGSAPSEENFVMEVNLPHLDDTNLAAASLCHAKNSGYFDDALLEKYVLDSPTRTRNPDCYQSDEASKSKSGLNLTTKNPQAFTDQPLDQAFIFDLEEPNSSETRAFNQVLDGFDDEYRGALHDEEPEADNMVDLAESKAIEPFNLIIETQQSAKFDVRQVESQYEDVPDEYDQPSQNPDQDDCDFPSAGLFPEVFGEELIHTGNCPGMSQKADDDEFDEGLDDSDLLVVMPDVLMLENQSGQPQRSLQSENVLQLDDPVPQITGIDDDEYSMDDFEYDELLKLPDPTKEVIERFQSPASLQYGFEDQTSEVYDTSLQLSPPYSSVSASSIVKLANRSGLESTDQNNYQSPIRDPAYQEDIHHSREEWSFLDSRNGNERYESSLHPEELLLTKAERHSCMRSELTTQKFRAQSSQLLQTALSNSSTTRLDDSHEYEPLKRFTRPDFPNLIRDRSPVIGLSSQIFLRVCFRIAEMFREGKRCNSMGHDAIIELFGRVTESSREAGTVKQHFQFADLFDDHPPFPRGILMNCKTTGLAETESRALLGEGEKLVRCVGRLKRDLKSATGWLLHILTIRSTDWEEIRYTKRIVSADELRPANF